MKVGIAILAACMLVACSQAEPDLPEKPDGQAFTDYWHQGKAEITRYALSQARYGETHEGDAVLIFVTEPFLTREQVKRDFGEDPAQTVLKLNATRKFNTGIYPYSLMTSVFTTTDFAKPQTPKVSFSGQEWCGHVFMQLNKEKKKYRALIRSYFQSEGDQELKLPDVPLEDAVWTTLRVAPQELPLGTLKMIPALQYLRLNHEDADAYKVKATLEEVRNARFAKEAVPCYRLEYPKLDRVLEIYFEKEAPHRILGWREEGKGRGGKQITEAVATHEMMTPYWGQNGKKDLPLREQLGLRP